VRLLVTRPALDGARTAAVLRTRGHEVALAPLLRIDVLTAELGSGPWDGVVLTSGNAARALAAHPRCAELVQLPAYAVGRRTTGAARAAGFQNVTSADGDADDLAQLLAQAPRPARLLYLAGEDQASDLAAVLGRAGLEVETVVMYRAVAEPILPSDIESALARGAIDGVLHFSVRSAAAFVAALAAADLRPALALPQFCLSAGVGEPLAAAGARDLRIAARPDEAALLELVG
jgi:uroporphyrinogen-III synthase